MTRHDYIDIAAAIALAMKEAKNQDERQGVTLAAVSVGGLFEERSTGFKLQLFLENCGVQPR